MSDIRQPGNARLGRLPTGADQQAETERAEQTNNTHGSAASRLGTEHVTPTGLHPTQVVHDTHEARRITDRENLTVTGRGTDGHASQPSTPVARLLNTGSRLDPHAGARSFINNLHALDFNENNDSDSMTASFLKLESTNMSTNQSIEGYLNQAKHFLREAAFKIEKRLSKENPDSLLQQADQLEQQAAAMVHQALEDSGQSGGQLDQMLSEMESGGEMSAMTQAQVQEAWLKVYDSADRAIREAAVASKQELEAIGRGDTAAAAAAHERAEAAESRARQMLSSAGIVVSAADGEALGKLALKMEAEGDHRNVMTRFLEEHPDRAQKMLPPEKWAEVKDQGGEAIVKAIMEYQGSQMDPLSMDSLGLAMNAADQQALSGIMGQFPEAGAIQGALAGAAALLVQAHELRIRAYNMKEQLLDAQNAIHEGKTDDGQFGVMRRNMIAQDEIMRGFARLTGGSRADRQLREDANMEARRSRTEVISLMRDMIEHDQRTHMQRRGREVRT